MGSLGSGVQNHDGLGNVLHERRQRRHEQLDWVLCASERRAPGLLEYRPQGRVRIAERGDLIPDGNAKRSIGMHPSSEKRTGRELRALSGGVAPAVVATPARLGVVAVEMPAGSPRRCR
jgi:hypothetical protein